MFSFTGSVIRRHRNAGDAHAAGAEHQRSPQERQIKSYGSAVFSGKSLIDFKMKFGSRSIRISLQSRLWSRSANENR